ncbi:PilC/PilY family type IV pilus protein [Thermodesulfovibrio sp. 1176]|uniref:pilus assembly protein n=1 Tax=Thermodesulfovibrio sp. 1176 TaxID=3043424 RepID=UPI002482BF69|nr:PilC/PilY family type IV pilus protein [Thermodesulfovibrio sp. 1176]MDI1471139.1 PilC/PilY family type IV pilus protein [Thermodesulfovibrio sp. 1176]
MRKLGLILLVLLIISAVIPSDQTMNKSYANVEMGNYCYAPPSIATTVPPLVMLVMGRDHKLYYEAYNDASDLDGDGRLDVGYKHSIDYYGYFDPYKCYNYSGSGANAKFVPVSRTSNKYCSGAWSGNFLNWLTMSRMDVLKKVLYGGDRIKDDANETVLEASYIPQDAHSWGKEYSGSDTPQLTPFSVPSSGRRHLFCITSTSAGDTRRIRVALNDPNRIWEWASTERAVCSGPDTPSSWRRGPVGTRNDIEDYVIRVQVCNLSVGLEPNCKRYPQGTYKPIGLLQKYGEYEGGGKWCSKSLKSCNTDSDCNITTDGLCVDRGKMYFGFLTGSYTNNLSGGVLRKNSWTIQDEINSQTGIFQTSENTPGNIILTIDRMRPIGFRYSDFSYQAAEGGTCGWITEAPLQEGQCRMWGNPIGEMMYEALRYLAGKGTPTSSFTYSGTQDSGLNLSKPNWGIQKGSDRYQPYQLFPICAKPFMIVLSDINTSYDSDRLPGSSFGGITGDLTGLNVSTLANTISSGEGISGNYFIGESGALYDFICSPKNVTGFSNIRGLCPEEPTKQGSYYSASVAYYGNTAFRDNFTGTKPFNVKTYSVALASPIPDIAIKVGNNTVRISPFAKSVSGCLGVFTNCAQRCTFTRDETTGRFTISNCQANAFCPTNQIVDFYVEQMDYDSNNNLTYARFSINFEDVEQGADHDMDAVIKYEITPVGTNQIRVRLTSDYAAGCIDQVLGFFISGTTEDGQWLVLKDRDVSGADGDTPAVVANMPGSPTTSPGGITYWERTFTVSGSTGGQLKDPLWYAAKWGGFDDQNGNNRPDLQSEWDKDGDGIPDTYFYVVNPLKMEQELEKAFSDILRKASSGATVATLSSQTGFSSLLIQPYYYPRYQTAEGTEISWIGFLRSMWVDFNQNIREDTVINKILDLIGSSFDKIIKFITVENETKIAVLERDSEVGPNACTMEAIKELDTIKPVFDSSCWLCDINPGSRIIKYNSGSGLAAFNESAASSLRPIWQAVDGNINTDTKAGCIIKYLRGENVRGDSACSNLPNIRRSRELNLSTNQLCPGMSGEKTWRLGDIIHSNPTVVSEQPVNIYHKKYGDTTYAEFINTTQYKNRPSILFVGANDGMLHAFRVGTIINQASFNQPVKLQNAPNDTETDKIGGEEWAFIPRNALPYLVWYGREDFSTCHVPTVDYRTFIVDAKIGSESDEWRGWRTLLIGVMGFGGREISSNIVYSSSIFVLDITNPTNPSLLWEKALDDRTLTLSFPAVIKIGNNWYVVAGTGPRDPQGTQFTTAKLYFFNLNDGTEARQPITVETGLNASVGDLMPTDPDFDYSDDAIYFGVYTTNSGNFYRLYIRNGLANATLSRAVTVGAPVFASPTFTKDENNQLWVFFGTGRFLGDADKSIGYTNYLIGFKDGCWNKDNNSYTAGCSTTYTLSQFTNTTNITVQATITAIKKVCNCTATSCSLVDVAYKTNPVSIYDEVTRGWYITLTNPREAIFSQPLIYGGTLDALSFEPSNDVCIPGGTTKLIALNYKSGTADPRPAVYSPLAVQGSIAIGQTVTINPKIALGFGSPPLGNPFQISPTLGQEAKKFVQLSGGIIIELPQLGGGGGRFISWIEK